MYKSVFKAKQQQPGRGLSQHYTPPAVHTENSWLCVWVLWCHDNVQVYNCYARLLNLKNRSGPLGMSGRSTGCWWNCRCQNTAKFQTNIKL